MSDEIMSDETVSDETMSGGKPDDLLLYERAGVNGVCPSPSCWRVRIALAKKGLPHQTKQMRFVEVDELEAETGSRTVPVLMVGDKPIIGSDQIALELDRMVSGAKLRDPTVDALLFSVESDLSNRILPLVARDMLPKLDKSDHAYYQSSREVKLEHDFDAFEGMRGGLQLDLAFAIGRLETDLGGRKTFGANGPNWADIVIYCHLLRLSFVSPRSWPELPEALQVWWEGRDQAWRRICLAPA
jgi:glutathione S-transferase